MTGLRHEAIRLWKKHRRLQEHEMLILNRKLHCEDEETELIDTVPCSTDTIAEIEDAIFFQEVLALLTPQQQKVIASTVLTGATERETAAKLGISQSVVHRIKERALNRLREYFSLE